MPPRPGDVYSDPGTPWLGKTVFCLASGYSLYRLTADEWAGIVAMQRERAGAVIAVNSSIKTARANGCEPDAVFFTDQNWWEDNTQLLDDFPGRVFTVCRNARAARDKFERIENILRPDFKVGQPPMRDGRSSGHRAVSVAVLCGAKRIVLLGFDMRVDPDTGRSHCHTDYQHPEMNRTFVDEFLPSFGGWYKDALAVGCEIINCTDGSILEEFPKALLSVILRGVACDGDTVSIHAEERAGAV